MNLTLAKYLKKTSLSVLLLLPSIAGNTWAGPANDRDSAFSEHPREVNALMFAELTPALQDSFNQQVTSELDGAYVYLDLANHFYQTSLDGFGHWFTVQFYEEVNHARMISNFLTTRGAAVKMSSLPSPSVNKGTALEIFQAGLAIEEAQTKKIHNLYALSESLGQYDASSFLKFFLDEQVQEEGMFSNIADRLKMLAGDPTGILALDRELAARVMPAAFNRAARP